MLELWKVLAILDFHPKETVHEEKWQYRRDDRIAQKNPENHSIARKANARNLQPAVISPTYKPFPLHASSPQRLVTHTAVLHRLFFLQTPAMPALEAPKHTGSKISFSNSRHVCTSTPSRCPMRRAELQMDAYLGVPHSQNRFPLSGQQTI